MCLWQLCLDSDCLWTETEAGDGVGSLVSELHGDLDAAVWVCIGSASFSRLHFDILIWSDWHFKRQVIAQDEIWPHVMSFLQWARQFDIIYHALSSRIWNDINSPRTNKSSAMNDRATCVRKQAEVPAYFMKLQWRQLWKFCRNDVVKQSTIDLHWMHHNHLFKMRGTSNSLSSPQSADSKTASVSVGLLHANQIKSVNQSWPKMSSEWLLMTQSDYSAHLNQGFKYFTWWPPPHWCWSWFGLLSRMWLQQDVIGECC